MSKIIYKFAKHTHVSVAYIVVVKTDWNIYECNEDQTLLKKKLTINSFRWIFSIIIHTHWTILKAKSYFVGASSTTNVMSLYNISTVNGHSLCVANFFVLV